MKEDKLEKTILENRQFFDDKDPNQNVWNNIKFQIGIRKSSYHWIWKAAAIVFFSTSAFLLVERNPGETSPITQNEQFSETELYYLGEIDQKTELISQLSDRTILGEEAERDLHRLDAMYQVLKEEFDKNPSKEVKDALVLNLILRIDILNDELEKVDTSVEDSDVSI